MQVLNFEDVQAFAASYPRAFQGEPMLASWEEQDCWIINPLQTRGDFFNITAGTFGLTERVASEFRELFIEVAELLPIRLEGRRHYLINVIRTATVFDKERATLRMRGGQWVGGVERYAFREASVRKETIFFIPEVFGVMFSVTNHDEPARDFVRRCADCGFVGLQFTPLWTSARGPVT